jgi:response regulator RpfG family c-di-GMP phosphodiesterase
MPKPTKILVVDDEAVIRELLIDILSDEAYFVDSASNGRTALALLREQPDFVLLFTDIMMPEMDGITLIREARSVCPTIIPIVMTGYATLETARAAVKEGAYDYVMKPFSLSEIKLAVSNALERYSLANENARLREVTELFNISEALASFHDEHKLLEFVLKASLDRVNAKRGSLMLMSPDGRALEVATSIGVPEDAAKTIVEVGTGISGLVAQNAQPMLIENIKESPEIQDRIRKLQNGSFISIPIERKTAVDSPIHGSSNNNRVLAVLNVTDKADGHFTEGDLKLLSIVANHAAAAIENVRLIRHIEHAHISTLESMALLLEAKDAYTHGHSQRVRDYCILVAARMGMSTQDIETLNLGAMLHDIGKIGVKDAVLNKTERLTDDEWMMIRQHPVIGFDVLEQVPILTKDHLALVRSHHERLDGTGYPDALSGDDLSQLVRIIAVADSFDAMSSSRAYRAALSQDKVISELKRCSGAQLDQKVVDLFVQLIQSGDVWRP